MARVSLSDGDVLSLRLWKKYAEHAMLRNQNPLPAFFFDRHAEGSRTRSDVLAYVAKLYRWQMSPLVDEFDGDLADLLQRGREKPLRIASLLGLSDRQIMAWGKGVGRATVRRIRSNLAYSFEYWFRTSPPNNPHLHTGEWK